MPSGGQKPIGPDWRTAVEPVRARWKRANEYGLDTEWWAFFLGGLVHEEKISIEKLAEHAERACIEWDV